MMASTTSMTPGTRPLADFAGTIVLVGAGKMGSAMLEAWLALGLPPASVVVLEPQPSRELGTLTSRGLQLNPAITAAREASAIIVAVKPQVAPEVVPTLRPYFGAGTVLVSIMAGRTLGFIEGALAQRAALVRAMPNTPALIGAGISGLYAMSGVDGEGRTRASSALEAVGGILWCEREEDLDSITAVSGSGPAYVFYFIEALEQAARDLGFEPTQARRLALATFSGATRLAEQSDSEPAVLRAQVTSKGGTTERAIAALDNATVKAAIVDAVRAAAARACELGDFFGNER